VTRPSHNPWHDLFAFLLLVSGLLVMVLVLLATRHYYAGFGFIGRGLAWIVIVGGVAALLSLAQSLLRLYIRPMMAEGRARFVDGARRRRRNP
jgi:hypothetical protein